MKAIACVLALFPAAATVFEAADDQPPKVDAPPIRYQALVKEFYAAARTLWTAETDADRAAAAAIVVNQITPNMLHLAENNPSDPIAPDALIAVLIQEIWLENNTKHPGTGKDRPAPKAVAILLRDHLQSEKMADATRRVAYGFGPECEQLLRSVLASSKRNDVQGLACLRLAQFLNARLQRLDLLNERPEMAHRYAGLFGEDYLSRLHRLDRRVSLREIESLFERAAAEFADVKQPYGGTVGAKARSELHELRHLSVGKTAQEIEGEDQDGVRFKLTDYRSKVVLLYFWSEY